MPIMSDFTKKTKFRQLKNQERMKTKETLFSYIEILEQQVQELNKRLENCERWIMERIAIDLRDYSNLEKELTEQSEDRSDDGRSEKGEDWWEQDPIPTTEDA